MTEVCAVSLFNVYLPTDYHDIDSHDQFGMCMGELSCYLDVARTKTSYVGVIGDCNANSYGSLFFSELMTFCSDNDLVASDLLFLGPASNNYTYVSAAHGSTSWLDHCLCSPNLHSTIDTVQGGKKYMSRFEMHVAEPNMTETLTFIHHEIARVLNFLMSYHKLSRNEDVAQYQGKY